MKKLHFIFSLLLIIELTNAQTNIITRERVLKVFEKEKDSFKEWYSCNNEDSYTKGDTIYLYNNADYYLQDWKCTQLVQLKFTANDTFNENEFGFNNLEKKASILEMGLSKMEVVAQDDSVFIYKYYNQKLVDKFYVKELNEIYLNDKKFKSTQIKLIRIH